MPTQIVKLVNKKNIADGTMEFHFEKPPGFDYKPGQFVDLILINPLETDQAGNVRTFTLASAPNEKDLVIASRMRDTAFKRALKKQSRGSEVKIDGPMGSFTLHNNTSRSAVFLAGGIGITPFFSIIKSTTEEKTAHKIYLFYSNRTQNSSPYLRELSELASGNPNFTFIPTVTDEKWKGETGYIDKQMVEKYLPDLNKPIYYIAGPPTMVTSLKKMLTQAGINDDDVRLEEFAGY